MWREEIARAGGRARSILLCCVFAPRYGENSICFFPGGYKSNVTEEG